jgi:formylglycine-generating enzyme required for sulfatase activity
LDEIRSYITLTRQAAPAPAVVPVVRPARLHFEPELVPVPAGPFLMGTTDEQIKALLARYDWARKAQENGWFADEQRQHEVTVAAFEIGRYPVTNANYAEFVKAAGYAPPGHWREDRFPEELADHPVVNVTWRDARAYVEWLAERTSQSYRLPTEAEWEKAARGGDGRHWPWGDEWDPARANCQPAGPGTTTPVGQYSPGGDSPCGCADMAGNVWEWCSSLYKPYPYRADDGREGLEGGEARILRGGSWRQDSPALVRCASRGGNYPDYRGDYYGFRVARGSLM